MNTYDPVPNFAALGAVNLTALAIPEAALEPARRTLFLSSEPGYVIFRNFLDSGQVAHLRQFWAGVDPSFGHEPFAGKHQIVKDCPNMSVADDQGNRTFHNFLWNQPLDELTWTIGWMVHGLRNRLSGRPFFAEALPGSGKVLNQRVVLTRNASTWIAPHRDYLVYDRRFEKNMYDFSRLQATLFLARKGEDYDGRGFVLETNAGTSLSFGTDIEIAPGDLAIWRYNNLHSVEGVVSKPDQIGFLRMLFPLETLATASAVSPVAPRPSIARRTVAALKRRLDVL